VQETLVIPANIGGAHWGGLAFDSARQLAIVPVNRLATAVRLIPREQMKGRMGDSGSRIHAEYTDMGGTPYVMRREIVRSPKGMPCTPPPFGELVGVSLATGRVAWRTPLGSIQPLLPDSVRAAPEWGSPNLGGPIATAGGLVFIGAALDHFVRAFDTQTGRELWKGALPAGGKATPMTYRARPGGRQFVVIAAGGSGGPWGKGDELVAFALP
jgi:quinoprotein glucose dehydrogenase